MGFYKYIAPMALGFNSKLTSWKIVSATAFRSEDRDGSFERNLKSGSGKAFFKRRSLLPVGRQPCRHRERHVTRLAVSVPNPFSPPSVMPGGRAGRMKIASSQ
jgi:hypothetical protein